MSVNVYPMPDSVGCYQLVGSLYGNYRAFATVLFYRWTGVNLGYGLDDPDHRLYADPMAQIEADRSPEQWIQTTLVYVLRNLVARLIGKTIMDEDASQQLKHALERTAVVFGRLLPFRTSPLSFDAFAEGVECDDLWDLIKESTDDMSSQEAEPAHVLQAFARLCVGTDTRLVLLHAMAAVGETPTFLFTTCVPCPSLSTTESPDEQELPLNLAVDAATPASLEQVMAPDSVCLFTRTVRDLVPMLQTPCDVVPPLTYSLVDEALHTLQPSKIRFLLPCCMPDTLRLPRAPRVRRFVLRDWELVATDPPADLDMSDYRLKGGVLLCRGQPLLTIDGSRISEAGPVDGRGAGETGGQTALLTPRHQLVLALAADRHLKEAVKLQAPVAPVSAYVFPETLSCPCTPALLEFFGQQASHFVLCRDGSILHRYGDSDGMSDLVISEKGIEYSVKSACVPVRDTTPLVATVDVQQGVDSKLVHYITQR